MTDKRSDAVALYAIETDRPLPAASTAVLQRVVGRPFASGQSGNPAGRPRNSRNKISELFAAIVRDDLATYGYEAVAKLRERDPASYLHLIHSMIPQAALTKCEEELEKIDFDKLTDREFVELMDEGKNSTDISKHLRSQAVDMVLARKVGTMREAMTLLGAKLD